LLLLRASSVSHEEGGLIEINSLAHLDMLIKEKHGVIVGFTDNHESPDA